MTRNTPILLTISLLTTPVTVGQTIDTLYLRDGSVLKGIVVKDGQGGYLVQSRHGVLSVDAEEILYRLPKDDDLHTISESYILLEGTLEAIAILQRDVPAQRKGVQEFLVLVPGLVEAVRDGSDEEIPFERQEIGDLSKVTIRFDGYIIDGDLPDAPVPWMP